MTDNPRAPWRGRRIGRYTVLEKLGAGGMGIVYSAFDAELGRKVAIKVLNSHAATLEHSTEARARLLREAQAMARLAHPNVVAIHDVGTFESDVFLAMEHVEGGSLKQWLKTEHTLAERLAALVAAGRGLAAAHAAGLVHRDFKPDNVLVGNDGRVRVTDFGIARTEEPPAPVSPAAPPVTQATRPAPSAGEMGAASASAGDADAAATLATPLSTPLTMTGSLLGTVGYMAPEQVLGENVDARSDQFSFCATLYETLYGEKPFSAKDLDDYLSALVAPVREPPADTEVPQWMRRVLLKGLESSPDARYPSMDALLSALHADPAAAGRRWALRAVIAAAVLVLGILFVRTQRAGAPICTAPPGQLAGAWDDAIAADVRKAFVATGAPNAVDTYARVAKVLGAYSSSWTAMQTEACEASQVHRAQSADVYRLRTQCLEQQRVELHALTSMLLGADASVVSSAVKAAYGLPPLAGCADVRALQAAPGLPTDPPKRAAVLAARASLAEANALDLGGLYKEALPVAERAVAAARAASHEGTVAEGLRLVGNVREKLGDFAGAEEASADAAWAAIAAGSDPVCVRAATDAAFLVGERLQRPLEGKRWLALAYAALKRMGGNEELEAAIAMRQAAIDDGHPELAVPLLERAASVERRAVGVHPQTQLALFNLGIRYVEIGRIDSAVTALSEARAMADQLYGADSRASALGWYGLGYASLAVGRLADAATQLERAREGLARNGDTFWVARVLGYLTEVAALQGNAAQAQALGRQALALWEQTGVEPYSYFLVVSAGPLVDAGMAAEGLALCDRALAPQEKGWIDPEKVYEGDSLRCRGEALVALGRAHDARAPLERTVALPRRIFAGDLARARFALARALDADPKSDVSDRARAYALALDAQKDMAPFSELRAPRERIDAWLAARASRAPR